MVSALPGNMLMDDTQTYICMLTLKGVVTLFQPKKCGKWKQLLIVAHTLKLPCVCGDLH